MLRIGTLSLESCVFLAPLAGLSDAALRLISRSHGARFTFVEMINARAITHNSKKTNKMLKSPAEDRPLGVQLLGAEIPYLLRAVDILAAYDFALLDFNAACPVRKVCRRGEGAALMRDPLMLEKILKALAGRWRKPLTLKIRSGWNDSSKNAVEIARIAEGSGVQAVFIHGRHREQFYHGGVDYGIIACVKKSVTIPVIASGDIWSCTHARKMFDETGCDGLTVARGALGNPWIFRDIEEYERNRRIPEAPSQQEITDVLLRHLDLSIAEHGEKNAVALMRKFAGWYFQGKPYVRLLRQKINTVRSKKEFVETLLPLVSLAET